jgi:hypothetical protein
MQTQEIEGKLLNNWLKVCQKNFGAVPRSPGWLERSGYLSIPTPSWAKNDGLQTFFKGQDRLISQGKLVWGNIIQANTLLFSPGQAYCPADVVFPTLLTCDFNPETLREIANKIFKLKGTSPSDPELLEIANHMTDECDRAFGLSVPSDLCLDIPCEISTIFVNRKHLPNGYLSRLLIPLIVSPEAPKTAMILPSRYWSSDMVDWWLN